jgi:protein-S-isoprenylcysteine O-methyltransferase Ste14
VIVRALIAFAVLPGMVAVGFPAGWLWYTAHLQPIHPLGLMLVAVGLAALLRCVRDFYMSGQGTLAPWQPPRRLVTVGLYRYSRNPMYISVAVALLGWVTAYDSLALLAYTAAAAGAFSLQVVFGEEPELARRYGDAWRRYAERVPRWL